MFTGKCLAAASILPLHPGIGQHNPIHNHGKSLRKLHLCAFNFIFRIYFYSVQNNTILANNIKIFSKLSLSLYQINIYIKNCQIADL